MTQAYDKWVLFACEICGRSIKHPMISTYSPNLYCRHNTPFDTIYVMKVVAQGPHDPQG